MSASVVNIPNDDYIIKVTPGGTITLDTGQLQGDVIFTGNITVGGSQTIVNVNTLAIADGSGAASNYTLTNGTLTISSLSKTSTINIAGILNDTLDKKNYTVIDTLSFPKNSTLFTFNSMLKASSFEPLKISSISKFSGLNPI